MTSLLSILALGFFLGMRHATDADHVIAVATIVARERNARSAAVIGAAWGVGHTLTILVVGGAITVASALTTNWVFPALARLDSFADYAAAAEPVAVAATDPTAKPITRDPPSAPS